MTHSSLVLEGYALQPRQAPLANARSEPPASPCAPRQVPARAQQRLAIELDVDLVTEHGVCQGFSENLSRGGIFVATHLVKPVGSKVEFCIHLPAGFDRVCGVGEVRWLRGNDEWSDVPPGIGILFVRLEPGCSQTLARFAATLRLSGIVGDETQQP
jgi:uncharacterized protein (TIGR02266 family)